VGPSGNNFPSALNPNIDLLAKINELEQKKQVIDRTKFKASQFKGFQPFFSYFKFLRKWYEIDIFQFSGSPMTNDANICHFYGSADFVYVIWFNKYGVVASSYFFYPSTII
jgi:hypothetical protein